MIIFLYGADTFRSREKLKSLKDRFIREVDRSGLNLIELDGEKAGINDINKAIATQSFLSSKRMVVIRNILKATKNLQNEVLELLKKGKFREAKEDSPKVGSSGRADNILVFRDEAADKRGGLFKYLSGSKFKEEFQVLANNDLVKWIERRVEVKGGKISRQNAYFLASKSDGNLWALSGEIDKLLAGRKSKEIEKENIEQSYLVKLDDNIFNLTDAVGSNNKKLALKLINEQLEAGVNEIYLLTMIVRQFRILLQVKAELEKGISPQAAYAGGQANNRAIASELGLHPFVIQKAIPQASKYSLDQLKKIYNRLLEVDVRLKLGESGKTLLELFVVEI